MEFGYTLNKEKKEFYFLLRTQGLGIEPEHKDIFFNKFTKIDENKTKLYRGARLGLAISKQLVNLLGGKTWLEFEVNKDTEFYFTMPSN